MILLFDSKVLGGTDQEQPGGHQAVPRLQRQLSSDSRGQDRHPQKDERGGGRGSIWRRATILQGNIRIDFWMQMWHFVLGAAICCVRYVDAKSLKYFDRFELQLGTISQFVKATHPYLLLLHNQQPFLQYNFNNYISLSVNGRCYVWHFRTSAALSIRTQTMKTTLSTQWRRLPSTVEDVARVWVNMPHRNDSNE